MSNQNNIETQTFSKVSKSGSVKTTEVYSIHLYEESYMLILIRYAVEVKGPNGIEKSFKKMVFDTKREAKEHVEKTRKKLLQLIK